MNATNPVGVFDSGVGGLSVLREIRRELPNENLLYVADSAYAPYGEKPSRLIEERSIAVTEFLVARNAKAVVVACNTATSAAIETLRSRFPVHIVGVEPAVKPAAANTRSKIIGVLATSWTLSGEKFSSLISRFGPGVDVLVQPCPGLVEQVEAGEIRSDKTRALLEESVVPLVRKGADTIVLGCTHFPFLVPLMRDIVGPEIFILDPGDAIARELRRRLDNHDQLRAVAMGAEWFWTSGSTDRANRIMSQLWGTPVNARRLPEHNDRGV